MMTTTTSLKNEKFIIFESNLRSYRNSNRVLADIELVLQNIDTLILCTGPQDGVERLCVSGTIPMYWRRKQHRVPVGIWITEEYPITSPYVELQPLVTTKIKPGLKYINNLGRVEIPYLTVWNPNNTLLELIENMSSIFSDEPPFEINTEELSGHSSAYLQNQWSSKSWIQKENSVGYKSIKTQNAISYSTKKENKKVEQQQTCPKNKESNQLATVVEEVFKTLDDTFQSLQEEIMIQQDDRKKHLATQKKLTEELANLTKLSEFFDHEFCKILQYELNMDEGIQGSNNEKVSLDGNAFYEIVCCMLLSKTIQKCGESQKVRTLLEETDPKTLEYQQTMAKLKSIADAQKKIKRALCQGALQDLHHEEKTVKKKLDTILKKLDSSSVSL